MVGDRSPFGSFFVHSGTGFCCCSSSILELKYNRLFSMSRTSSLISPIFHSLVLSSSPLPLGLAFSSSAGSPQPPTPKVSSTSHEFQPPPPVNPPETVNPDPATLREQWKYATRMYSRWYGHAWGAVILAGVSFYALGWLIKGENPVAGTRGEEKKKGK